MTLVSNQKYKKFLAILVVILLVACGGGNYQQPEPQLSPSEKLRNTYVDAIKNANQQSKQCNDSIGATDEAKLVHKEVLFAGMKDENVQGLMNSKQHLNPKQSAALEKFMIQQKTCRGIRLNALNKVPYLPSAWIDYYKKYDALSSQLLAKRITIGDANQQWMSILQERNVHLNEARQKINSDLTAMHQKEIDLALRQQGVAAQQAQAEIARQANNRQVWKDFNQAVQPHWVDLTPSCLGPGCRQ